MGCENNCVNEHRFQQIEEDIKELRRKNSEEHGKFYNRIESVEKDMVESQGDRKHIREKLDEINENVETLIQAPSKRYDLVITSIITALVGGVAGFVLSGIFPM